MVTNIEGFYRENKKVDEKGISHSLSASSLRKEECYALYSIVKKYKPVKTLEVGLSLGGSAVGIITAKKESGLLEKHIALDPFQESHSNNVGLSELTKMGLADNIDHVSAFSEHYLDKMYCERKKFDFIFIDGSHSIGQAVTDAFLADKILNKNGIIGIHDSLMFSTAASIKYLVTEKKYRIIPGGDFSLKNLAKQFKYTRKLGLWYCAKVIPEIHISIVFLQKNEV